MVVLSEDEEEGVHELNGFGEVVPPQNIDDLVISLSCTVCVLAVEVVATMPRSSDHLIEHVEGEECESQIVDH